MPISKRAKREYDKKYRRENTRSIRKRERIRNITKHQITLEEFRALRKSQDEKCALCGKKLIFPNSFEDDRRKCRVAIDHDHECSLKGLHNPRRGCANCIRGLVCTYCNRCIIPGLDFIKSEYSHSYLSQRPVLSLRKTNGIV